MRKFIIGTRKSNLALTQTNLVIEWLRNTTTKNEFEIKEMSTAGDRKLDVSLAGLGSGGVFIDDIERPLLEGEIDFAVHSMKDLPVKMKDELVIASIPVRENAADAYIGRNNVKLHDLHPGAVIGTSSMRRAAQILAVRPDLKTHWIRGTVESRLKQLHAGDFDAIILAVAGLKRLGMEDEVITEKLPLDTFVPAAGQGALAIQCRKADTETVKVLEKINDDDAYNAVMTERKFTQLLDEADQAPIGAYAYVEEGKIVLHATVVSLDGSVFLKETTDGYDIDDVAHTAAEKFMNKGARKVIDAAKKELNS
ncbi:hydroxymethylbilane synthase [Virgibacillus sp. W0181]|uniref:hydroxymethylbilane synthase n=1 Tax=Virgibacillus sp. W0181 TaxID=3391581 RepID=UPI003F46E405